MANKRGVLSTCTVAVIGAGHLGQSIIRGLLEKGHKKIIATRRSEAGLSFLRERFSEIEVTSDNDYAMSKADIVIVASKEDQFESISRSVSGVSEKFFVSVGPTFSLDQLGDLFGSFVCRIMLPVNPKEDVLCYTMSKACESRERRVVSYVFGRGALEVEEQFMKIASVYTCLRGVLPSVFEPLLWVGNERCVDQELVRSMVGSMVKSMGEEMLQGVSSEKRLKEGSGGYNENSYTLRLHKRMLPLKDSLRGHLTQLAQDFSL